MEEIDHLPRLGEEIETKRCTLQQLMRQALETQRLLTFSLEKIWLDTNGNWSTEPMLEVKYGSFGFKVTGERGYFSEMWGNGHIVDDAIFLDGLFAHHAWLINHVHFSPLQSIRYRKIPETLSARILQRRLADGHVIQQVLRLRHSKGIEELVPYQQVEEQHWLGRWYQWINTTESEAGKPEWHLEWLRVEEACFATVSREIVDTRLYIPTLPLCVENAFDRAEIRGLVSDFLAGSDVYIPQNYVPSLSESEKRSQLEDAIWWMETRYRILPRYPRQRLVEFVTSLVLAGDVFHFPVAVGCAPMTTTEILWMYRNAGNNILRFLLIRSTQT